MKSNEETAMNISTRVQRFICGVVIVGAILLVPSLPDGFLPSNLCKAAFAGVTAAILIVIINKLIGKSRRPRGAGEAPNEESDYP